MEWVSQFLMVPLESLELNEIKMLNTRHDVKPCMNGTKYKPGGGIVGISRSTTFSATGLGDVCSGVLAASSGGDASVGLGGATPKPS